ncbi:MAG: hypothetical protein ACKVXR_08680 [Planctomycetota bacterium]
MLLRPFLGPILVAIGAQEAPRIELPAGPAAEVLKRLEAVPPAVLPVLPSDPWARPETWKRWAEILVLETQASEPDPLRSAELALLALAQGRYEDAWERFEPCGSSSPVARALLPHFLPGARSYPLADGAVLAPALPPPSSAEARAAGSVRGGIDRREMKIEGLVVGAATIAMKVSVEIEGVQIDVQHLSGGPVQLAIAIPRDPRFGFSDEYVDWYRAEVKGVAHALSIQPGDEEHTLYARFEPRAPEWPTLLPEEVPAQVASGGLRIVARGGNGELDLLRAVAESLTAGPLRIPAVLHEEGSPSGDFLGVTIDLTDPALRPRKLAWIAGAVERRCFARPR